MNAAWNMVGIVVMVVIIIIGYIALYKFAIHYQENITNWENKIYIHLKKFR